LAGRVIHSSAPIRICDNGGWTDTWFAGHGRVLNMAVRPRAEVEIEVSADGRGTDAPRVWLRAENYGHSYAPALDAPGWGSHPLLEATIRRMGVPEGVALDIGIFCEVPGGASTGTSAAVTVALIGALDRLTPGRLTPREVAETAHSVEVDMLHQQCGIQDQLCCAYGGVNYIEMDRYPHAQVTRLDLPDPVWWELDRRLVLITLGRAHRSSDVHEQVIAELEGAGPEASRLEDLRAAALAARDALLAADFAAFGRSMIANTEAQARLHPALVSADAWRIIDVARRHGAAGWKVNGAGGEGGSITLLGGPSSAARRAMIRAIEEENSLFRHVPVGLSRTGLAVWEVARS
jgi:D-glycero-alpha-D-manno-heptose-7-phosphate kinase